MDDKHSKATVLCTQRFTVIMFFACCRVMSQLTFSMLTKTVPLSATVNVMLTYDCLVFVVACSGFVCSYLYVCCIEWKLSLGNVQMSTKHNATGSEGTKLGTRVLYKFMCL